MLGVKCKNNNHILISCMSRKGLKHIKTKKYNNDLLTLLYSIIILDPVIIAKYNIILDVEPRDNETNMKVAEQHIPGSRSI